MIHKTVYFGLLACAAAFAQLESAIITGTTAPAAAKAGQTAAKGVTSTMNRAANTLAAAAGSSAPARPASTNTPVAGAAAVNPNVSETKSDFNRDDIKVGMTREEMIAVAGKPYSKITIPIDGGSSERLTFRMKDGDLVRIVLELEKVTEVKLLEGAR